MAKPTPLPRRLLTLQEAADVLGVHPKSIRRWISSGHLRGYRIGPRAVRLDAADIDALRRPLTEYREK